MTGSVANNFKVVPVYVSSDVAASSGTLVVPYPAGFDNGDFDQAQGHFMMMNGKKMAQPTDIGLSFGDTAGVTVTNRTTAIIPAGSQGFFQFAVPGKKSSLFTRGDASLQPKPVKAQKLETVLINLGSPLTADADGVCASQTVVIATTPNAVINGALASGGVVTFDVPRNVVATWTTTSVLTITGTDVYDRTMVEASASGTSHTGKKAFKTITKCSFSIGVTSATIGSGVVLGLPVRIPGPFAILKELQDGVQRPRRPDYIRLPWQFTEAEMDAGTIRYLAPGIAGTIVDAGVCLDAAVTTGGTITFKVGTTTVVGLSLVVANSAAAGAVATDAPTVGDASTAVVATDYIQIVGDAAFDASCPTNGWIGIQLTSPLDGTLVAGLAQDTVPLSTSADTLGTYTPFTTPTGAITYSLVASVSDPEYIGVQFAG